MITQLLQVFSHAGEAHESSAEATSHLVGSWYIMLPLFILAVAGLAAIVQLLFKKIDITAIVTSFALLVSGFTLYNVSALVSILSITIGLMLAMAITLIGLQSPAKTTKKKG